MNCGSFCSLVPISGSPALVGLLRGVLALFYPFLRRFVGSSCTLMLPLEWGCPGLEPARIVAPFGPIQHWWQYHVFRAFPVPISPSYCPIWPPFSFLTWWGCSLKETSTPGPYPVKSDAPGPNKAFLPCVKANCPWNVTIPYALGAIAPLQANNLIPHHSFI